MDFDSIQIDLHKNFTIKSLTDFSSGKELPYIRDERAVYISYKQTKDQSFIIKIDYEGKPVVAKKAPWYGGFVWKKDSEGNPWIGVACESDGASIWWPCKDHTSDEADSVTMHYTFRNHHGVAMDNC
jgi:aminopeptidase N